MRGPPVLGLEGTAAKPLEWVLEGRLARTDRTGRGAPQNPRYLAPWTSSDALGRLSTSYFCVKETWLDPGSIFPGRPMCPDRLPLSASPSIPSVPKPSRTWSAPADPPGAGLVSTLTNVGLCGPGARDLETDTRVHTHSHAPSLLWCRV